MIERLVFQRSKTVIMRYHLIIYIKFNYFIRIRLFYNITSTVSILLTTKTTTNKLKFVRMRRGTLLKNIKRLL